VAGRPFDLVDGRIQMDSHCCGIEPAECADNSIVSGKDPIWRVSGNTVCSFLRNAEVLQADPFRTSRIEALNKLRRDPLRFMVARKRLEKFAERSIGITLLFPDLPSDLVPLRPEIIAFFENLIFGAPVIALERAHDKIFGGGDPPNFRGLSVNELGAKLYRSRQVSVAQRVNAATESVARFQDGYEHAGVSEALRRRKTCNSGSDYEDGSHESPSLPSMFAALRGPILAESQTIIAPHTLKFGTGGFNEKSESKGARSFSSAAHMVFPLLRADCALRPEDNAPGKSLPPGLLHKNHARSDQEVISHR
jgi:hypothetical protein